MSRTARWWLLGLLGTATLIYVAMRLIAQEMGSDYRPYRGADSASAARAAGTLIAVYTPRRSTDRISLQGNESAYAVHPQWKELGFLLLPKVKTSPLARLTVEIDDYPGGYQFEFNDLGQVQLDHEGVPHPL